MAFPYLEAVVVFMISIYIFETYLNLRQYAALKLSTLPKPLVGVISRRKFEKSRAYSLDKNYFRFVRGAVAMLTDTVVLYFGILPWFWKVVDLSFSLYSIFVIKTQHGFSKKTLWLFFRDVSKDLCLYIIIGPPIVAAVIVIVQKGGPYLAIYLWGFMFALSIVMMTLYPIAIAPLFNKFSSLPDGQLTWNIENLASSLKFSLKKLFVVHGSTRSSHSNCQNKEVVAVIAYELGYWKLSHTIYKFIALQVLSFLQHGGYNLERNSKDLFESFGFDTQPMLIGLILFQLTVIPLQHLVDFGLTLVTRSFEFQILDPNRKDGFFTQANAFAKKLGYSKPLRAVLVKWQMIIFRSVFIKKLSTCLYMQ